MDEALEREICRRLDRIQDITRDLEAVLGQSQGLMDARGYDRKCGEVRVHCDWIRNHMGDRGQDWMQSERPLASRARPLVGWDG